MSSYKDNLYSARWAISEAIEKDRNDLLDFAVDKIAQAKADFITQDVFEDEIDDIEPISERPKYKPKDPVIKQSPSKVKVKGSFKTKTGYFDMICIHYHAGVEDESSRKDADNILKYLGSQGYGCIAQDHDGTFYIPSNLDFESQWGSNIGKSRFGNRTSISQYAVGIEVINSGKLVKYGTGYYAWYDLKYNSSNRPIGVKSGKSSHPNPRIITNKRDNHLVGAWDPYTQDQEDGLIDFCVHYCKKFNIPVSHIVGHDTVAGYRGKTDPGGSLSMTIPEFREVIQSYL